MKSQQQSVDSHFNDHPFNIFFSVDLVKYVNGKSIFTFRVRDEFSSDSCQSAGVLGVAADYIARIAGQKLIGECSVLEQEVYLRTKVPGRSWVASAKIDYSDNQNAAYCCKIYAVTGRRNRLIGETQGTLVSGEG